MELFNTPVEGSVVAMNTDGDNGYDISRRRFFQLAAGVTGGGLLLSACRKSPSNNVSLGKGDTGLFNYLYIIAQVQAGFYAQACATPYYNGSITQQSEVDLMADLRDHQLAYAGLFAKILDKYAISKIVLQLSQVTFADRTSTLTHATILQDWAVGAYNGAMQLVSNKNFLTFLTKIAAVEGRHAEYVREALNYNTFGDNTVIDSNGLGQALSPHVALPLFQTYIQTTFDSSGVPSF